MKVFYIVFLVSIVLHAKKITLEKIADNRKPLRFLEPTELAINQRVVTNHVDSRQFLLPLYHEYFLEVLDSYHRVGSELLKKFNEFKSNDDLNELGVFWQWLETHGGDQLNRFRYFSDAELREHQVDIHGGKIRVPTNTQLNEHRELMFYLDENGSLYLAAETERVPDVQAVGHTSMTRGGPVAAIGGIIFNNDGTIKKIKASSGHYRPDEYQTYLLLQKLVSSEVDINRIELKFKKICMVQEPNKSENRKACTLNVNAREWFDFMNQCAQGGDVVNCHYQPKQVQETFG